VAASQAHSTLRGIQLSCLAKILAANNLTANVTSYPPDMLLFFDPAGVPGNACFTQVRNHTCKEFYSLASQGNLNLLPNGSAQRTALLNKALLCLGGVNNTLSQEQLSSLGALVCDMEPAAITDSDPQILENLKLCPDLAGAQRAALNARLSRGDSHYGHPPPELIREIEVLSSGDAVVWRSIFQSFSMTSAPQPCSLSSPRASKTGQEILSLPIPRSFLGTSGGKSLPYGKNFMEFQDWLFSYQVWAFEACLSNEVLKANLVPLLAHPLPEEYLDVMKGKLSEIYPAGIPEDQLQLLGQLSRRYEDDTLSALLDPSGGRWQAAEAKQLITRYMDLGGTLTGPLLQKIGGRDLCGLEDDQINKISPEAIGTAGKVDISSCSQSKKDRLYAKARDAFASQRGTSAYYPLIRPYLGGAPRKDLEDLAGSTIAMDIDTFTALKPSELQNLSVQHVKNLLGVNLPDLKRAENHPAVANWIQRRYQSELDRVLGIGLHGGLP
uniref:Mesothelin like n=1 Tax=Pelodiscus sinensis TaxID=13735 RepID=K7G5L4_PELSI